MKEMQTDDRNGHFLATMPIHQAFVDEKAYLASIGKELGDAIQQQLVWHIQGLAHVWA